MGVSGGVLEGAEEAEETEERPGPGVGRLKQLEGVADPLGRDPRGVERLAIRREEPCEPADDPAKAAAGPSAEVRVGGGARGEGASPFRREPAPPEGEGPLDEGDVARIDADGRQLSREDERPETGVRRLLPRRQERPPDLFRPEDREPAAELPGRRARRLAVPLSGYPPEEARKRLRPAQRDPEIVDELLVPGGACPIRERPELLALGGDGLLEETEDRAGPERRQDGPPRAILAPGR